MDELEPLRTCTKCGLDKELEQFSRNYRYPSGYTRRCKRCLIEQHKEYRKTSGGKASMRKSLLKRRYGISPEQFQDMVSKQGGKCANPGCDAAGTHVDHDHNTSAVRALLCSGCNLALGNLYENVDKILGLADYAKRFKN